METKGLGAGAQNASRLRFETQHDAFNFARQSVEEGQRFMARNGFSCSNYYLEGNCEIHLHVTSLSDSSKLKLVSHIVPFVDTNGKRASTVEPFALKNGSCILHGYVKDALVFIGGGHSAECPKQVISAKIWLEPSQKIDEIGVNISTSPFDLILKILWFLPKWKMNARYVASAQKSRPVTECLVKRVTKVGNDSRGQGANFSRHPLPQTKIDDLFAGLRIVLSDNLVSAALDKSVASLFKIDEAFFSALD